MIEEYVVRRRAGFLDRVKTFLGGIRVYALVGKSGTGKSFRAKLVAEKYDIPYIIDDGLLIHGKSIVAGKSAKREKIYMSAVRTALFDDQLHRYEVIKAIRARKMHKILIIGTSERMVARTAERLELPPPSKIVLIEEISSKEDIEKAQKSRNDEGKHVIPVPSIEVERDYPQLFSKSIKILFQIGRGVGRRKDRDSKVYEKSVVQPAFHVGTKGKIAISSNALGQMIAHCVDEFDGTLIVKRVKIRPENGVYFIRAEIKIPYGNQFTENLSELHDYIVDRIEKFTGIIISKLDLVISGISKRNKDWVSDEHETPEIQD